jgi:hypothetical protein
MESAKAVKTMLEKFPGRSNAIDLIYKMGDGFNLNSFSIHTAIQYLDMMIANTLLEDAP